MEAAGDSQASCAQDRIRILMVDDSESVGLAVRELVASIEGVDFVYCGDPLRAVETARTCSPSVILQDVDMPHLSGYDLLRMYRRSLEVRMVPVIIHTARGSSEDKARAFALGASDYLVKHEDPLELKARLLYHAQRFHRLRRSQACGIQPISSSHSIKVLMIEESITAGMMVAKLLEKEPDITIRVCRDEATALAMADEYLPTVILLGLYVGDRKVFDLLRTIRETEATRDVPVIILSATNQPSLKADFLAGGANDFVEKSTDLVELVSRIRSHSSNYYSMLQAKVVTDPTPVDEEDSVRVLLVDDSLTACQVLRDQLASERQIAFEFVVDPRLALERVRSFRPTVVLLDLVMPEIDGLTLLQELRENPSTADVPVVILSEIGDPATKGKAFALGASDYMGKAVDKIELVSRLHLHSQGHRNAKNLASYIQRSLEDRRRAEIYGQFIRKTFGRYVSDEIVDNLLATPEALEMGGDKREITILMSDLRGFTSIAERLAAEQVIRVINNHLEVMTEIVFAHGGTIDEFIGDSILAMFGAPRRDDDHARKAVACALAMQLAMGRVNAKNAEEGLPAVEAGIAVNTGEVVVGNIGCERRTKYGVVGRHVNLTSRIEAYAHGGQVLVAQSTRDQVGDILRIRGQIVAEFKGVPHPITIHDVSGIGGGFDQFLPERSRSDWFWPLETTPVRFRIHTGKTKSDVEQEGAIVAWAGKDVWIEAREAAPPYTSVEIRIEPSGETAEAKVLPGEGEPGRSFVVHVTWCDEPFGRLAERMERVRTADVGTVSRIRPRTRPSEFPVHETYRE